MALLTKQYITRAKDIEIQNHLERMTHFQHAIEALIQDSKREKHQHDLRMMELDKLESLLADSPDMPIALSQALAPIQPVSAKAPAHAAPSLPASAKQPLKQKKSRNPVPSKRQKPLPSHASANS